VRDSDKEVQVHGPVLAVLEGAKAVEDEDFARRLFGSQSFVKEQTVASESFTQPLDRAVRDLELAGDLAEA
jgi:hypothetical protein